MATSITASNVAPFSLPQLTDINYIVSASFPSASAAANSSPSIAFNDLTWPVVGKFVIQVSNTALSNSAGGVTSYVTLQSSTDNTNWTNVFPLSSSVLNCKDNSGTVVAGQTQLLLPPVTSPFQTTYYLRIQTNTPAGGATLGGISGSAVLTVLF